MRRKFVWDSPDGRPPIAKLIEEGWLVIGGKALAEGYEPPPLAPEPPKPKASVVVGPWRSAPEPVRRGGTVHSADQAELFAADAMPGPRPVRKRRQYRPRESMDSTRQRGLFDEPEGDR
ncbi:MAG: hypothetical protein WDN69_05120 [Aliidongia sp.]